MVSRQTGNGENESQGQDVAAEGNPGGEGSSGGDASLEETAEREREYLRGRLREEWGREPSDEELDEWLREHTEGY